MTAITPFLFEDEHLVRVIERDGEAWFVGSDVCRILGYANGPQALGRLDADERGIYSIDTPGGPQEMIVISEPGIYRLVFGSKKPAAERFKRWLAHEVLPAIRKTGRYEAKPADLPPETVADTPLADFRVWVDMVKSAYRIHGRSAARRLWAQSPLPQVDSDDIPMSVREAEADLDGPGCLRHLLDWVPRGTTRTVEDMVAERDNPDVVRFLRQRGIVPDPKGFVGWVAVSNTNRELTRHFATTRWRGNWAAALVQLPDARRHPSVIHFDVTTRAVLVKL